MHPGQDLQTSKRYACKKCKQLFRNRSGLTQHTHAKHPRFSPPPAASDVPDNHELDGDYLMDTEPGPSNVPSTAPDVPGNYDMDHIHSAFVGLGDALFRNYHPGLTG